MTSTAFPDLEDAALLRDHFHFVLLRDDPKGPPLTGSSSWGAFSWARLKKNSKRKNRPKSEGLFVGLYFLDPLLYVPVAFFNDSNSRFLGLLCVSSMTVPFNPRRMLRSQLETSCFKLTGPSTADLQMKKGKPMR